MQLLENRRDYLEKKLKKKLSGSSERVERTHRLIMRGASLENILPETKNLTEQEFYQLMESVFSDEKLKGIIDYRIEHIIKNRGGKQ